MFDDVVVVFYSCQCVTCSPTKSVYPVGIRHTESSGVRFGGTLWCSARGEIHPAVCGGGCSDGYPQRVSVTVTGDNIPVSVVTLTEESLGVSQNMVPCQCTSTRRFSDEN